jgi:hypothetical protein
MAREILLGEHIQRECMRIILGGENSFKSPKSIRNNSEDQLRKFVTVITVAPISGIASIWLGKGGELGPSGDPPTFLVGSNDLDGQGTNAW